MIRKLFERALSGLRTQGSPFDFSGVGGASIIGGFIQENEQNSKLVGREKYTTYSNMLANTPIVAASTRLYLNMVAKAKWSVVPADIEGREEEAKRIAEKIEELIHDMDTPWHRVVRRSAMFKAYGFSLQEWTAERKPDGTIGFKDIRPRPQITIERWDRQNDEIVGAVQRDPQTAEEHYLPRQKLVYLVDDSLNDSPEGVGLFRHVAETVRELELYEHLEAVGFETDLNGMPLGRAPLSALQSMVKQNLLSQEKMNSIVNGFELFIKNKIKDPSRGLVLDSQPFSSTGENRTPSTNRMWDLEIMKSPSGSQKEVGEGVVRKNFEIARIFGTENLLFGANGVGSFAMSRDKTNTFGLMVDGTLLEIKEAYERDVLDPLFELNGWDRELKPKFQTEPIQHRDLESITGALKDLAVAGAPMPVDDPAVNHIRENAGLPILEEVDTEMLLATGLIANDTTQNQRDSELDPDTMESNSDN